jgi:hypothetical protein
LLDLNTPLFNLDKHTLFWKIIKQARKTANKGQKFLNKVNSAKLACVNRATSISDNTTISKEYVYCGKPDCHRRHGTYYYAYWKDANGNRKLKKNTLVNTFKEEQIMKVRTTLRR